MIYGLTERDPLLRLICQKVPKAGADQVKPQYGCRYDEREEVAIIPAPNAVVQPDTVVVEGLDTVIADSAVVAPRRSPDVAGFAVFDWHIHRSRVRRRESNHDPIVD